MSEQERDPNWRVRVEEAAPAKPVQKPDPPTFHYKLRTYDATVWGIGKGAAFSSALAEMSKPWAGTRP